MKSKAREFDLRVAVEVMGWRQLDVSLKDAFEKHILPASEYPFFETFNDDGVITYHPTPYHRETFSPTQNENDDIAVLMTLLSKKSASVESILATLHLKHHLRSMKEAGYTPSDLFYRFSRYYVTGDLAEIAIHLKDNEFIKKNKSISELSRDLWDKHAFGLGGIISMDCVDNILRVECYDISQATDDIKKDFEEHLAPYNIQVIFFGHVR